MIAFCATLFFRSNLAVAETRSAIVTVSVRVAESCRIDAASVSTNENVDLKMRCSLKARPNIHFDPAPETAGSLSMAKSADGARTLRIDF